MGVWSFFLLLLLSVSSSLEQDNSTLKQSERRGKALKISKKPCTDPSGRHGVCTFKWDCINRNGTLMGTCLDGFIFGTCCHYDSDPFLYDTMHDNFIESNNISPPQIIRRTTTTTTTVQPTTTTTSISTTTRKPAFLSSLTTKKPASTTLRPVIVSIPSAQLVTWTSVGPTRRPVPLRPIVLQPFPFRPGTQFPTIHGGWPVGVAFPVDPFQINRPLQVLRPPKLPQVPAGSAPNVSFTIFGAGPNRTTLGSSTTKEIEMTTVSVPIPQWSTATILTTSKPLFAIASSTSTTKKPFTTGKPSKSQPLQPLDYRKDCGVRSIRSRARIVGGQNAEFGRWPWQVLVKEAAWLGLYQKNKCGGVLISSRYAITAGHCQPGRFLSALVVILGETDLLSDTEQFKPEMRRVKKMIVHRHYNPQNFDNDIAVLEIDPPVIFKPHISPICLPEPGEDFTGKMAYVTGWGKTSHGGSIPNLLQEVEVPIMTNSECISMFKEAGHAKLIKDTFLCAGYKQGGKDSCEGDSGGPLMVKRKNGQWVLAGTVSHGIRCADPNLPGVYMRISAYRPWIDKITK